MSASGALPITLSDELRNSLLDWNERMGVLVRSPERYSPTELVAARDRLNEEGQHLAVRVQAEQSNQVEVRFLKE